MTLEEIKEAKASRNRIENLSKYKLCEIDLDSYIESICIRLAHKYFKIDNTFCVFVDLPVRHDIFSDSFENQLEKLFITKSKEITSIESIEYYGIDNIVFNKK